MYTIREETYELVKELVSVGVDPATSGTLVPSKLTNNLVWKDDRMPDSMEEMLGDYGVPSKFSAGLFERPASFGASSGGPYVGGELSPTDSSMSGSCYSLFSSGSSETDNQNMKLVWDKLIVIQGEQDECEFCSIEPIDRRPYAPHPTYANGKLCCPILIASKNSQRAFQATGGTSSKSAKQQKKK